MLRLPPGDDAAPTAEAIRAAGAHTLVLDSYRHDAAWLAGVHAVTGCTRVVLDDVGDRVLACELVVNPAPYAASVTYAAGGGAQVLAGPRFAMLRPEFTPAQRPARAYVQALADRAGLRAAPPSPTAPAPWSPRTASTPSCK